MVTWNAGNNHSRAGTHRSRCIRNISGGVVTPKKVVQQLLETLPDSCTYEDIKRHIDLFDKLHSNEEAVMLGASARLEIERYPR